MRSSASDGIALGGQEPGLSFVLICGCVDGETQVFRLAFGSLKKTLQEQRNQKWGLSG